MASTFNVTLDGKTITVDLDEARRFCPAETEAMERAWQQVVRTKQASEEVYRTMADLLHALAEKKREQ